MGMDTGDTTTTAIAYVRVSTQEQESGGHSLDDQEHTLRLLGESRGWNVVVVRETGSGKSVTARPLLLKALADLDAGRAQVLMAVRLDRLSRSVADFTGLMDRAERHGWNLHVADLGLDTTTPSGRLVAQVLAATAEHERRLIGERTREGLRGARAAGVQLGRPVEIESEIAATIVHLRDQGFSYRQIAGYLSETGARTPRGGFWHASTVRQVYVRETAGASSAA